VPCWIDAVPDQLNEDSDIDKHLEAAVTNARKQSLATSTAQFNVDEELVRERERRQQKQQEREKKRKSMGAVQEEEFDQGVSMDFTKPVGRILSVATGADESMDLTKAVGGILKASAATPSGNTSLNMSQFFKGMNTPGASSDVFNPSTAARALDLGMF